MSALKDLVDSVNAIAGKPTQFSRAVDQLADLSEAGHYADERAEATLPLDLPIMPAPTRTIDKRAILSALAFIRAEIEKSC